MRASAVARGRPELGEPAALVADILGGRPARPLPHAVVAALANLELARTPR